MNMNLITGRPGLRRAVAAIFFVSVLALVPSASSAGDLFPISNDSLFKLLFNYQCKDRAEADAKMRAILFNHLWNYYRSDMGFVDLTDMTVFVHTSDALGDVRVRGFKLEDSVRVWLAEQGLTVFQRAYDSKDHIDEYLTKVRRNVDRGLDSAAELWQELQRYRPSAGVRIWINNKPMDPVEDWDAAQWKSSITLLFSQRMFLERDFLWGPTACDADTWEQTVYAESLGKDHAAEVARKLKELVGEFAAAVAKNREVYGAP